MTIPLKQSTASQEIPLGHFLDSTDGDTEEDGLTIANTDIKLWKNGTTTLANKNSGGATNISNGVYHATLDATDTNTLGPLVIFVHVSGALAVRVECVVYPSNVYDSLFSTDRLQVDVREMGSSALDLTTTMKASINSEVDSALNTAIPGSPTADSINERIKSIDDKLPSGTISDFDEATNGVDVTKISGSATAADNLEASALTIITGQAQTGTLSTTQMTTNLSEATDDHYNGRIIIWTSGVLTGQATDITDYDGTSKLLTFTAVTEAPSNGDGFIII